MKSCRCERTKPLQNKTPAPGVLDVHAATRGRQIRSRAREGEGREQGPEKEREGSVPDVLFGGWVGGEGASTCTLALKRVMGGGVALHGVKASSCFCSGGARVAFIGGSGGSGGCVGIGVVGGAPVLDMII
eukprot:scaffold20503_cov101-Isochrysis_galbana.AAC.1